MAKLTKSERIREVVKSSQAIVDKVCELNSAVDVLVARVNQNGYPKPTGEEPT